MKRILACLSAVAIAVLIAGCGKTEEQKEPEIIPEIKLTDDKVSSGITLDEGSTSAVVAFSCNVPWTASVSEDWVSVSPSSGSSGKNTITLKAKENDTEKARAAVLTISGNGSQSSVSVKIRQAGKVKAIFVLDIDNIDLPAEGGDFQVTVTHNIGYEVASVPDWISMTDKVTAGDKDTHTFKAKANEAFQKRSDIIVFHNDLDESVPVKVTQAEAVPTNIVFEDANFKAYMVSNFDKDNDGEINSREALDITSINVGTDNIKSLTGIEHAVNLKSLYCRGDEKGLLERLDVSKNINLTTLVCDENNLSELNLTNNIALDTLICGYNPLSKLDVTSNTTLRYLVCCGAKLTSLDLSRNTKLTYLMLLFNELTSIDVSNCPDLETFSCGENRITSTLDVSRCGKLKVFQCQRNEIERIIMTPSKDLYNFYCNDNRLRSLDLSQNTGLEDFSCYRNNLTALDVSSNTKLTGIFCNNNSIETLDISKNPSLELLLCDDNAIKSLDLSKNPSLKTLECNNNLIETLDISQNKGLIFFYCLKNPMKCLYVNEGQYENIRYKKIPDGIAVATKSLPGGEASKWADKEFWHKSLGLRFTATWCVICPRMANAFDKAEKLYPNKIETFNLHPRSSTYFFEETPKFETLLKCFGYPTANIDFRRQVDVQDKSDDTARLLVNAVKETELYYPTKSGISFSSSVSGNELSLNVKLYLKARGDYKLAAFLLEDGIIGYQEGTGGLIEHNSIARLAISDAEGDAFSAPEDRMTVVKNYTAVIPDVCDKKNLRILVYVFRKYGTQSIIRTADYGDYYVDNATSATLGAKKELAFKDGSALGGNEDTKDGGEIILK